MQSKKKKRCQVYMRFVVLYFLLVSQPQRLLKDPNVDTYTPYGRRTYVVTQRSCNTPLITRDIRRVSLSCSSSVSSRKKRGRMMMSIPLEAILIFILIAIIFALKVSE